MRRALVPDVVALTLVVSASFVKFAVLAVDVAVCSGSAELHPLRFFGRVASCALQHSRMVAGTSCCGSVEVLLVILVG